MSKNNLPEGTYTGHLVHFENQAEFNAVFIIDNADDETLIGKGCLYSLRRFIEPKSKKE